ncbi:hypothetical protein [Streptomyces sp. NPDC048349]|uniref:SHOCT domain-containing protein n=1 Tax=Streptomyces sp. NPDC048349 TaxID=3155486 RepID=UPI00344496E1
MFIRPVGATVHAANRSAGHPLLRGLLARATGTVGPDTPAPAPPRGLLGRAVRAAEDTTPWPPDQEPEPDSEPWPPDHEAGPWPPDPDAPEEPPPTRPPTPPALPTGLVAELTQLAALAREGHLTPEEFATAKARLLRD